MTVGAHAADEQPSRGWRRHVVGMVLGILVVAALIGHARLAHELQLTSAREFVIWPQRLLFALVFLWGVVLVVVACLAARFPTLPTIVAVVLIYGAFASLPISARLLPVLGPWQPRMATILGADGNYLWHGYALLVMAGAMTAAAARGWWSLARDRQRRLLPPDGDGASRTMR